jgi:hypothetical protein
MWKVMGEPKTEPPFDKLREIPGAEDLAINQPKYYSRRWKLLG